jgi:predicted nucleic acid-binding protein
MAVVVDASAIAAIAFGEPEGSTIAAHLEGETLLAPALLDVELTNVAVKKVRKRPETLENVTLCLLAALRLPITRVAVPGGEVFAVAQRTGLTAYDACYLWLARARDAELVTLDSTLARLADELRRPMPR